MNKYSIGKIYKITDNTNGNIYYGSTIQTLYERLGEHERHFNSFIRNKYRWQQSFKIIMNNNYTIEKVEDYPCTSKRELTKREDYYIVNYNCINYRRAYNTPEEKKAIKAIADQKRHKKNRDEKNEQYKKLLKKKKEYCSQIIKCPNCDKSFRLDNINKHRKTKYCLTYKNQN